MRYANFRVVELVGPRQSGKTTLARTFVPPDSINYFDLENPLHLARLDQPMTALQDLQGVVVIDEVQRRPDLFPILRVLADRTPLPACFLVLGSAAPTWLQQSSESLAGRLKIVPVAGFSLPEVGGGALEQLWLRGGFPLSFLAVDATRQPGVAAGVHAGSGRTRPAAIGCKYACVVCFSASG